MKLNRKRLLVAAGGVTAVGAAATLVTGVTFGLFSSAQGGPVNSFSAGTVTLDRTVSVTCTISKIAPGDGSVIGALSAPLNNNDTALAVSAISRAVNSGDTLALPGTGVTVTASSSAASGATSIPINAAAVAHTVASGAAVADQSVGQTCLMPFHYSGSLPAYLALDVATAGSTNGNGTSSSASPSGPALTLNPTVPVQGTNVEVTAPAGSFSGPVTIQAGSTTLASPSNATSFPVAGDGSLDATFVAPVAGIYTLVITDGSHTSTLPNFSVNLPRLFDGTPTGLQLQLAGASGPAFIQGVHYLQEGGTPATVNPTGVTSDLLLAPVPAVNGSSGTIALDWVLPTAAGNNYQGGVSTVTLTLKAVQSAHQTVPGDCLSGEQCLDQTGLAWG